LAIILLIQTKKKDVVRLSKLYLPGMAVGFESEKIRLHIGDGFEFLKNHQKEFDVIITDSSDPEGALR
jgi:spermidine synthase